MKNMTGINNQENKYPYCSINDKKPCDVFECVYARGMKTDNVVIIKKVKKLSATFITFRALSL